jgi:F-type H+-transporting ATPase subunit delta
MPLLNSVTTPSAEALLQVVNENSQTEEMVSEVKQLLELLNDSPELDKALSSPILETEAKKKIIIEIFSNKVNSSLLNFLKLLADRQRIGILTSILNRFLEIYRENSNIALATVTSAVELTDEQKGLITQKIVNIAGTEKLELVTKIDPSLIGGFVASVGSKVIDASLASQIRKLGLSLSK